MGKKIKSINVELKIDRKYFQVWLSIDSIVALLNSVWNICPAS